MSENWQPKTPPTEPSIQDHVIRLATENGRLEEQIKQLGQQITELQEKNRDLVARASAVSAPPGMYHILWLNDDEYHRYSDAVVADPKKPVFVMLSPDVAVSTRFIDKGKDKFYLDKNMCKLWAVGVIALAREPDIVEKLSNRLRQAALCLHQFDKKDEVGK